jgi:hypothetical protein
MIGPIANALSDASARAAVPDVQWVANDVP